MRVGPRKGSQSVFYGVGTGAIIGIIMLALSSAVEDFDPIDLVEERRKMVFLLKMLKGVCDDRQTALGMDLVDRVSELPG